MNPRDIVIADYDYPLPDERIAKHPMEHRDGSKLLVLRGKELCESRFSHISELLDPATLLVFNNTKVIHARLFFPKTTGAVIEIFCLEPHNMPIAQAFEQRGCSSWNCFVGNNKRWKEPALNRKLSVEGRTVTLQATRREAVGNSWVIDFTWDSDDTFAALLEQVGTIPLPPYLHRAAEEEDKERYQTVYARHEGSVAAPTAGLHFTDSILATLQQHGIATEYLTLHVGAGTFKPVSSNTIGEHDMHVEQIQIGYDNIARIAAHSHGPIVAVGTTSVRTLESIYWFGIQLGMQPNLSQMFVQQWDPYELEQQAVPMQESYRRVMAWMQQHDLTELHGATRLLIAPGYKYRFINGLVTNFHQPKSTLLLLVSALIGEQWKECYQYALEHDFRFLSYGDSCLFLPQQQEIQTIANRP